MAAEADAGRRIDEWLASQRDGLSRTRAARLIRTGSVLVNGDPTKPSRRLEAADEIAVWFGEDRPAAPAPQDIEFEVVYQDQGIVAVNKPPNLAVHPGAGRPDGTLVNGLLSRYPEIAAVGGPHRPGIVHRLDMDTSGIVLVARTDEEYLSLVEQFANRTVSKTYLALVEGTLAHESGLISAPLGRQASDRRKMQVDWSGKAATTRFRVAASSDRASFLELDLITGRTHQIRVHLAAVGHPVIGDATYGKSAPSSSTRNLPRRAPRQMLHAWQISADRGDGSRITCRAELPGDFLRAAGELDIPESVLSGYTSTSWSTGPKGPRPAC